MSDIQWCHFLEEARKAAKTDGRLRLIKFFRFQCDGCNTIKRLFPTRRGGAHNFTAKNGVKTE